MCVCLSVEQYVVLASVAVLGTKWKQIDSFEDNNVDGSTGKPPPRQRALEVVSHQKLDAVLRAFELVLRPPPAYMVLVTHALRRNGKPPQNHVPKLPPKTDYVLVFVRGVQCSVNFPLILSNYVEILLIGAASGIVLL